MSQNKAEPAKWMVHILILNMNPQKDPFWVRTTHIYKTLWWDSHSRVPGIKLASVVRHPMLYVAHECSIHLESPISRHVLHRSFSYHHIIIIIISHIPVCLLVEPMLVCLLVSPLLVNLCFVFLFLQGSIAVLISRYALEVSPTAQWEILYHVNVVNPPLFNEQTPRLPSIRGGKQPLMTGLVLALTHYRFLVIVVISTYITHGHDINL